MIPRFPALAPCALAAALLAGCSAERNARPPDLASRRDSAAPAAVPQAKAGDNDSLSEPVTVVEFTEAGGSGVVPVLAAEPDTTVAYVEQGARLVGSVGPYAFALLRRQIYSCGVHGNQLDSFVTVDLSRQRPVTLLDDTLVAALIGEYRPDAAGAFKADTLTGEPGSQPFDTDSIELTVLFPRLRGPRLELAYQFTAGACYACSDNRWSSYSRSVILPARALPPALAPWADVPVEVQAALRLLRAAPDSGAGWSEIVMARQRRDALAHLFGVSAPAGGREYLVWRRVSGGMFETVWLRGSGVEATIVGRQPAVWIVAGGRAWTWHERTETVPTRPCSMQNPYEEKP